MAKKFVKKILKRGGWDVRRHDHELDYYKKIFKKYQNYTMINEDTFVLNLQLCKKFAGITGDYVECGVWRGGMSAGISEIIGSDKVIHLFDSFEGLPPAREIDGVEALQWQQNTESPNYYNNCMAEEQFVKEVMEIAAFSNYKTYKGWFDQTLPSFTGNNIGILRLDGDWYDSILICMQQLFPKVTNGGIIIIDDYYTWDGCAKAIHDYLTFSKTASRVHQWHNQVAYIIKKNA